MNISDERYEQVGRTLCDFLLLNYAVAITLGRLAVATVAPIMLAEPTPEERKTALRTYLNCIHNGRRDAAMLIAVEHVFSARLASLTAKPDPAIEAVKALLVERRPL